MFIKVKCHSSETWCGQTKSDLDFRELPIFSYKNLVDKEEIGVGAFAVVFTAKLPDKSKVVVKKWISADEETKKSLIKEARLLQNLRHANVVEFKGICTDQLSLLLEYAYFDFSPFGCDSQTHSLAEFLAVCEQSSCDGMNVAVFAHAAFDVASGLKYLHQNNCCFLGPFSRARAQFLPIRTSYPVNNIYVFFVLEVSWICFASINVRFRNAK